jgi:hypothetical protein
MGQFFQSAGTWQAVMGTLAAVLIFVLSQNTNHENKEPFATHSFDSGATDTGCMSKTLKEQVRQVTLGCRSTGMPQDCVSLLLFLRR